MISTMKSLIEKLLEGKISKDEFLKEYPIDLKSNTAHFTKLLEEAKCQKNADDLEDIFYLGFSFNLFINEHIDILCELIVEKWHYKHEDMAMLLQKFKSPKSVDYLYSTILAEHEYLAYNDGEALISKCMWALGAVGTNYAKEKLLLLSKSENLIIREAAIHQVNKLSLA